MYLRTSHPILAAICLGVLAGCSHSRALAGDLDLRVAMSRVNSARAAFKETQYNYAPHVQAQGSVSFTGFVGFLSGDESQLGKAVSRAWLVNPAVSRPAFDFGTVHARFRGAKAEADGALPSYQKAVLLALEDFENACVCYSSQEARLASVLEQAQASRRAAQLAEIQYREGSINILVLLDAQRTLLQAEDELAQVEAAANTSAVAVYKALGGADGATGSST